jgi:pimeloyl-ACP methyl ester carboxylesterase
MLSHHLRVLYLHGFASSPGSRKARFFSEKLQELGFHVEIPDLAEGNFEALTISGQLKVIERAARQEPVLLIGSSLGAYLAALYAATHPEVRKLVLIAPAFQFHRLWTTSLGTERLDAWRKIGTLPILHYGEGREMPIGYQFIDDAGTYPAFPEFSQPAVIFHGTQDQVVPVQYSSEFAASHRNVRLTTFSSGHELTDVLDPMWQEMRAFLLGKPVDLRC